MANATACETIARIRQIQHSYEYVQIHRFQMACIVNELCSLFNTTPPSTTRLLPIPTISSPFQTAVCTPPTKSHKAQFSPEKSEVQTRKPSFIVQL